MPLLTTRRAPEVSINLLPSDVRQGQQTKRWFSIAVSAGVALLVLLGAITVLQRMQISSSERTLRTEQAKAAQLRTEVGSLRDYELLEATLNSTQSLLNTALAGDVSWTRFLDDLDTHMPNDSWLSTISVSATPGTTPDGQVSLGTAQYTAFVTSMPGLAGWLDTMSEVKGLQFVYLSSGSKSEGEDKVSFSASAHLTDTMLSGRCTTEDSQCP
jgi:Tfp pilus assembly protein PilN